MSDSIPPTKERLLRERRWTRTKATLLVLPTRLRSKLIHTRNGYQEHLLQWDIACKESSQCCQTFWIPEGFDWCMGRQPTVHSAVTWRRRTTWLPRCEHITGQLDPSYSPDWSSCDFEYRCNLKKAIGGTGYPTAVNSFKRVTDNRIRLTNVTNTVRKVSERWFRRVTNNKEYI